MHERIKLQGRSPFPIEQVFKWFLQTALVLHYLHQKKVIHRDIKPQNLFLDEVVLLVAMDCRTATSRLEILGYRACFNSHRTWLKRLSGRLSMSRRKSWKACPMILERMCGRWAVRSTKSWRWRLHLRVSACPIWCVVWKRACFSGSTTISSLLFSRSLYLSSYDLRTIIHSMLEVDPR